MEQFCINNKLTFIIFLTVSRDVHALPESSHELKHKQINFKENYCHSNLPSNLFSRSLTATSLNLSLSSYCFNSNSFLNNSSLEADLVPSIPTAIPTLDDTCGATCSSSVETSGRFDGYGNNTFIIELLRKTNVRL